MRGHSAAYNELPQEEKGVYDRVAAQRRLAREHELKGAVTMTQAECALATKRAAGEARQRGVRLRDSSCR